MDTQETKAMVDRCNKCGLCIPSLPRLPAGFDEAASPRGRVQLVKNFLEGNVSLSKRAKEIILTCLLCESCVVNCPSGVRQDHLFADFRDELVKQYGWNGRNVCSTPF